MHIRPIPYIYSHCNFLSGYCEYVGEKDDLSWAHGVSIKPGVHNKLLYRESPPGGPTPHPFTYHVWQKRYPFCIPYSFHSHKIHVLALLGFLQTEMTDFPTLSDFWSLKKVPVSAEPPRIGHYREYLPLGMLKSMVIGLEKLLVVESILRRVKGYIWGQVCRK